MAPAFGLLRVMHKLFTVANNLQAEKSCCYSPLHRILFQSLTLALAVTLACPASKADTPPTTQKLPGQHETGRPNIVLLLFDDAGYSDMSAFGGEIQTPNIERIVREGMTVKRFYTTARCSPTRAGILSGRHPHDVGMADLAGPKFNTHLPAYQGQLPLDIPLVSELLQAAGYQTYLEGKWHLGDIPGREPDPAAQAAPNLRGFDHFIGFIRGRAPPYPKPEQRVYQHNEKSIAFEQGWYSVKGLNDELINQLSQQFQTKAETPFFVYIGSQSPHDPLQGPQALIDQYRKVYQRPAEDLWQERVARMRQMSIFPPDAPTRMPLFSSQDVATIRATAATRAAMIESTDAEFGKLLRLLEENGKLANTLVIVTSDNGATSETFKLTNAPYRGAKATLHEGGILSPLVARWPAGKITGNGITNEMTTYLDLMPTLLQAAGVAYPVKWRSAAPLPALEGRNLLPVLRGATLPPPENFYWNLYGQYAVLHKGRWKLVANTRYDEASERKQAEPVLELYDLLADPAETTNLIVKEKALATTLLADYRVWARQHGAAPYYQVLDAYRKNGVGGGQLMKEQ
jgi:arylsulfatase A-like enzyme